MIKFFLIAISIVLIPCFTFSEDSTSDDNDGSYMTLSLGQDPSFGFYPSIAGGYPLNDKLKFTYYGIFWTQDALAGNSGGVGLLTEFGVGLNFTMLDGQLNINPTLGIGNGKFQSGGASHVIGDDIVPALYVTYTNDNLETTIGGIFWKGLRREQLVDKYRDQLQYFLNLWFLADKHLDVGLYYDHFMLTEEDLTSTTTNTTYFWVGPSIRFKTKSGASFWFSVGPDLVDYVNGNEQKNIREFYKMVFSVTF